jgi:hypothetical protein
VNAALARYRKFFDDLLSAYGNSSTLLDSIKKLQWSSSVGLWPLFSI